MFSLPQSSIPPLSEEDGSPPHTPPSSKKEYVVPQTPKKKRTKEKISVVQLDDASESLREEDDSGDLPARKEYEDEEADVEMGGDVVVEEATSEKATSEKATSEKTTSEETAEETTEEATTEEATAEDLERVKTLKELRDLCTKEGLSTAGKKGDLARRIAMKAM